MLKKLDDLLFKGVHIALLGFLLYCGLMYAPNSPAIPLLGFIIVLVVLWGIADIYFNISNHRINKQIKKYYH